MASHCRRENVLEGGHATVIKTVTRQLLLPVLGSTTDKTCRCAESLAFLLSQWVIGLAEALCFHGNIAGTIINNIIVIERQNQPLPDQCFFARAAQDFPSKKK